MIATCRGLRGRGALAALAAALAGAGCARANEPLVIAVAMGDGGQAAAIALSQDSARGEVPRLVLRDTRGASGIAGLPASVRIAELLSADRNVVGVVGPGSSRDALLAAPMYNAGSIPHVVPTATSRRLRGAGRWTLALAPDDSMEGSFAGHFIADRLRARRALILYVADEYGSGLREGTEAALTERGVVVADRIALEVSGRCRPGFAPNPYDDQITLALRKGAPDVVVLATRAAEAGCALQAIHRRMPRLRYVACDGVIPAALALDAPSEAVDSTYFITFWFADAADAETRAFSEEFRRRFQREPHYGDALVYDATRLIIDAVRSAGTDRRRVLEYLISLGRDRPAPAGLTGPLTFERSSRTAIVVVRRRGERTVAVDAP